MAKLLKISVAGWVRCPYFQKAANVVCALQHLYPSKVLANIVELPDRDKYRAWLPELYAKVPGAEGRTSSPLVWLNESDFLGGCDDTLEYARREFMAPSSSKPKIATGGVPDVGEGSYDYDLIVVGGGSGGLACSKQAASYGKKVAVLDFVKPSPAGSKWGLGGTCVNVGCIPKKLMHQAALLGESMSDAKAFGWKVEPTAIKHDWEAMVGSVQDHIHSLNFGYRVQLREKQVKYLNKLGTFVNKHEIQCVGKDGKAETITARRFVVAVGGRPRPLSCPGGELAISSDDLFSLKKAPGKSLVVGASYVALECAGFLAGLKYDVSVMVRSILLRGFDRDMSERIGQYMETHGTKFIRGSVPERLEKTSDGRIKVTWSGGKSDVFDTVFAAIGRDADTGSLGLDNVGVSVEKNGKLLATNEQVQGAPHVYAIGDVLQDRPELTPVAIQAASRV